MSSPLTDALAATRAAEQRKAARALLRRPLLRADGRDAGLFVLIARHARELREWFDQETGWRLSVSSEVARLCKVAADHHDSTHPATDIGRNVAFGRRRYVLVCLALAVLERADSQITLGRLAEQIVLAATDPELVSAGIAFTLERRDERSDLVAVVRLLLDLGVLERVAGEEQSFVDHGGDVLYDVRRRVMSGLLSSVRGPSVVQAGEFTERLAELNRELPATTDDLRNRRIRQFLTRILLDEPVLYYNRLSDAERAYLTSQRAAICARITAFTGLVAEVRAEGIAMIDPDDELTDIRMPEVGTEGHATLLIAERLAAAIGTPVPIADLRTFVRDISKDYVRQRVWRAGAAEPGAELALVDTAVDRLAALRLVERSARHSDPEWILPLPAIARYGITAPTITQPRAKESPE
ncbi:TIGR02678 family protein [Nocardia amamiensis]|uniref:TIGR02678 family protein n=1 Tax=Nocardia amamiensis TaxID=404578 RepID=UPI00082ED338|nr:TIGR02678 family protein [Nocardia amamiensis]